MTESGSDDKSTCNNQQAKYSMPKIHNQGNCNGDGGGGGGGGGGDSCDNGDDDNYVNIGNPHDLSNYFALYDAFKDLCNNNAEYFETDDSENGQRLHGAFMGLIDHLENARSHVKEIQTFVHEYDFNETVPGNGYRSFLLVVRSCISHGIKLSSYIMQHRSSMLFRKSMYMKEVEACNHLLASLCTCLHHLMILRQWSEPESLFPTGVHTAAELFATANTINQYSFYGRCLGVQYCKSMQSVLRFLSICMAGFSEAYYKKGGKFTKTTSSMWTGSQYYWNPELRARRIVNISQNAEIDFCKSFWSLAETELMHFLPKVIGSKIKVNKVITIPPEPLQLPHINDTQQMIDIPVPCSHVGSGSVTARLLSYNRHAGMIGEKNRKTNLLPPVDGFIFHCHGGGFVAQSSKSHELYLREWAVALNVPILSIDYSLAPDAPFPRAVEETFYAYCWAVKNCSLLGTTAKKIILAGDSAGANLNLAVALKCIKYHVRKPDGLFLAYCPVRINFDPSPARLLCLMDPLLPFGFMMRCLKAYACPNKNTLLANKNKLAEKNAIKYAKIETNNNASASTSSDVNNCRISDSDQLTYVHISDNHVNSSIKPHNSESDGSSMWEHIDFDPNMLDYKSPGSDGTSDTFASASLQSQTIGNTEMITPDESNGISFEEDSQPITIHKPLNTLDDQSNSTYMAAEEMLINEEMDSDNHTRPASAVHALELDQPTTPQSNGDSTVAEFVDRYILDTSNGQNVLVSVPTTKSEENILLDAGYDAINVQNVQRRFFKAVGNVTSSVSNTFSSITTSTPIDEPTDFAYVRQRLNSLIPKSPSEEFVFDIPKDPLLSPYWATDELLQQLPPTNILSVDMDPCLDDCVMFAKRLKSLNNSVELDILQGLPHGFLNFVKVSKEAHAGNKVCINRIAQLLSIENVGKVNA